MEINEFTRKVRNAVKEELGEAYRVELKEVRKNNGIIMHGLLIFSSLNNVIPTIYLDAFWEAYEEGAAFAAIVRRLLKIYREGSPRKDIDMGFFRYFEHVRDKICYRLIRQEGNEELLRDIPYLEFLDLALCFFYAYRDEQLGEGSILIYNSHLQSWGVKTAELLRAAERNTEKLFPWECIPMEELLADMPGVSVPTETEADGRLKKDLLPEVPMRVLTNQRRIYGAVCMLYPDVLEGLAAKEQRSLYILPSSVHETILLPETGEENAAEMRKMIKEVNHAHVAPEEVLSDNLYYYDLREKRVKIIF